MTTRYCPECATPHECEAAENAARLELARIEANRDIEIARLRSGEVKTEAAAAVEIAESEAVAIAARAEGEADGMETVLDAGAPPAPDGAEPPVIVDMPEPEPEPEPEPPAPPESEPPAESESKRAGWWDGYR